MYSFSYGMFRSHVRLRITLTLVRDIQHISRLRRVALTNAADSSIAHTHCGTTGNKLKRRRERGREARHYQSEYKNEEERLEVRIIQKFKIIAKKSDHSNLVCIARSLIQ